MSSFPSQVNPSTNGHLQEETVHLIKKHESSERVFVTYKTRWLVLGVFISHMMSNNAVWITFSPISTLTQCYYNVSLFWVNGLSWVYMLTYIIFSLFSVWFLERFGLKLTAVVAGTLNACGSWLRFAASHHSMFWLLFFGQTITSFTYLMENNGCSKVSAIWFPPNERTLATTLFTLFASQAGVLVGLLVGPLVVTGGHYNTSVPCEQLPASWTDTVYSQLFYYLLGQAVFATLVLPWSYFLPEAPPTPPSITAHVNKQDDESAVPFYKLLVKALSNRYFVLLIIANGILTGSSGSYVTVFQEVLHNSGYDHYQGIIGYLGASMTIMSIIGVLIIGKWIDYSRKYYETILGVSFLCVLVTLTLSLCVQFKVNFYFVFIAATFTSCVLSLTGGIMFEFAVEMTYPLPEAISAGLLNFFFQLVGIGMIIAVGLLVQHHLALYGNYVFVGLLLVACIVMVFVRQPLKRVKIEKEHKKNYFYQ